MEQLIKTLRRYNAMTDEEYGYLALFDDNSGNYRNEADEQIFDFETHAEAVEIMENAINERLTAIQNAG